MPIDIRKLITASALNRMIIGVEAAGAGGLSSPHQLSAADIGGPMCSLNSIHYLVESGEKTFVGRPYSAQSR